jgi:hypothetical protein
MLAAELRAAIEKRLAEYLADGQDIWGVAAIAKKHNALPVYLDMGGILFLSPSGEILTLAHDDGDSVRPEESIEWRTIAAVVASEKFPELVSLRPQRPTSAIDCSACGGTGHVTRHNLRCGECLSLGWKLAEWKLTPWSRPVS